MDRERKEQWIAALRSGEYEQGIGVLKYVRPGDGKAMHCCLGVLCELAVEAGVVQEMNPHSVERMFGDRPLNENDPNNIFTSDIVLPVKVQEWAGLDSVNPNIAMVVGNNIENMSLSQHNDSGATFAQIADLIEEFIPAE